MGNLSQPQEKKAKLEGEDEAKLGTETSSNDVIERGDVNQERSVSELQMSVARKLFLKFLCFDVLTVTKYQCWC